MYLVYLKKILLPVTPKSWSISYGNKNQTITLINEGEVNILKEQGLETIKFDAELPNNQYPYTRYLNGFRNADYFIDQFNKMIKAKKPFNLKIIREKQDGNRLKSTNIKVAFEGNIQYKESTDNGIDVIATITLKKYKSYGLKSYTIETIAPTTPAQSATNIIYAPKTQRSTENSPMPSQSINYTVKDGDTLWAIAKYHYGDGAKYNVIFDANKNTISNPSLIYAGQVIVIPCIT